MTGLWVSYSTYWIPNTFHCTYNNLIYLYTKYLYECFVL